MDDLVSRCGEKGIANLDGTCVFVAMYQFLRKTGLFPFIAEELRSSIETLMELGVHDFSDSACPRLPSAIWEAYKVINPDAPTDASDGVVPSSLFRAIVTESPELANRVTIAEVLAVKVRCLPWRSQSIFINTINTMSARHFDDFMFQTIFCDPRQSTIGETLIIFNARAVDAGCKQLRMLILYLLDFKDVGITGGLVNYNFPDGNNVVEGHTVAFARCENDFHFFNWGQMSTGTQLLHKTNGPICKYMTSSPKKPFSITSVGFLWERTAVTRPELIELESRWMPTEAEIIATREILMELYSTTPSQSAETRLKLSKLNSVQVKLLEWYWDNAAYKSQIKYIKQFIGNGRCWNDLQRSIDPTHTPTPEQKKIVQDIHEWAVANQKSPAVKKWTAVDGLVAERRRSRRNQIDWDSVPNYSKGDHVKTSLEHVHLQSIRHKIAATLTPSGSFIKELQTNSSKLAWLTTALTQNELETWIHFYTLDRGRDTLWRGAVIAHRTSQNTANLKVDRAEERALQFAAGGFEGNVYWKKGYKNCEPTLKGGEARRFEDERERQKWLQHTPKNPYDSSDEDVPPPNTDEAEFDQWEYDPVSPFNDRTL